MKNLTWMKAFLSPFKPPKIKFYIGKVAFGTPYFLPRKWVKYTEEEIYEKVKEKYRALPPNLHTYTEFERLVRYYSGLNHAIPKKIGFDFVDLGWKTKWSDTDYRHEWSPLWSFVFFRWQIAVMFVPDHRTHYWESWLYYELDTDKKQTKEERILQCLKKAPQIWTSISKEGKETTNYYTKILKKKYLYLISKEDYE